MRGFLLFILVIVVSETKAQAGFKKTTDSARVFTLNNQAKNKNNSTQRSGSLINDEKTNQQLIHDYDRLPESVRQKMASNKASGLALGRGIRKYYLFTVPFTAGSREAGYFETTIRSMTGFVSVTWVKEDAFQLHVETAILSEQVKEKVKQLNSAATMQDEVYYVY
ncbi:MAG: hypothetical protein ACKO5C_08390 [Ferruginibacter sp.]